MSKEVRVHVLFTPKESRRADFLGAMSKLVKGTNKEAGCKFFQIFEQVLKKFNYRKVQNSSLQYALHIVAGEQKHS